MMKLKKNNTGGKLEMYTCDGVFTDHQCDHLRKLVDARAEKAMVKIQNKDGTESDGVLTNSRNNEVLYGPVYDPIFKECEKRIADVLDISLLSGEVSQLSKYSPGEYYRKHLDVFTPKTPEDKKRMSEEGGQRTWSALVYLNDDFKGGSTGFSRVGVDIKPKKGMLVAWLNTNHNGTNNGNSLHEGHDVEDGIKYIFIKWFRENQNQHMFYAKHPQQNPENYFKLIKT